MQKILLPVLFLLAATLLPAQTPTTASVFFESDQSELSSEARQSLDALALQLLAAPDYSVNIEAWTDDQGTQAYNQQLATRRADAVQRYLAEKGLLLTKSSVRSWGEENLDYDNSTEENRRLNRRVDVAVSSVFFSDYRALQSRLTDNTEEVLSVHSDREQTLTASRGTVIVVPARAFVFEDGSSPTGPVELIVREAFSPSDFILHNLTTTSDGKILQTGGMVYVGAQSDGKPLVLAEGAALTVALPTGAVDPSMELFYGQQTTTGNGVNWKPAGRKFRQTLRDPIVKLDIDPALSKRIMSIKIPVYPQPSVPVFAGEMRAEPRKPVMPYRPHEPQKPARSSVQKMFGGGEGQRMSKKEVKKADKYYREALDKYRRDSTDFVRLYERYLKNMTNYELAKARFAEEHRQWELEVKSRIQSILTYEREEYLYRYTLALQNSVRYIGKNIHKYQYYSNLEGSLRDVTVDQQNQSLREGLTRYQGKQVTVGDLYYKLLGHSTVEEYRGFKKLFNEVRHATSDTSYRVVNRLIKSSGIEAISDSLRSEIRAKRMLTSATPEQADGAIRAYVADVTRLGWINCDKFSNDPAEKVQLVVNEPEDATMYVLCRDLNSVLPFYRDGQGAYVAGGLPKGRKVSVVSIKLKDGVPYFALQDTQAGAGALKMDYKSLSLRDLREELKKLNI